MRIVGLSAAAWVIILVAVAAYTALAPAYFLARAVLRGSALQANLLLQTGAVALQLRTDPAFTGAEACQRHRAVRPRLRRPSARVELHHQVGFHLHRVRHIGQLRRAGEAALHGAMVNLQVFRHVAFGAL